MSTSKKKKSGDDDGTARTSKVDADGNARTSKRTRNDATCDLDVILGQVKEEWKDIKSHWKNFWEKENKYWLSLDVSNPAWNSLFNLMGKNLNPEFRWARKRALVWLAFAANISVRIRHGENHFTFLLAKGQADDEDKAAARIFDYVKKMMLTRNQPATVFADRICWTTLFLCMIPLKSIEFDDCDLFKEVDKHELGAIRKFITSEQPQKQMRFIAQEIMSALKTSESMAKALKTSESNAKAVKRAELASSEKDVFTSRKRSKIQANLPSSEQFEKKVTYLIEKTQEDATNFDQTDVHVQAILSCPLGPFFEGGIPVFHDTWNEKKESLVQAEIKSRCFLLNTFDALKEFILAPVQSPDKFDYSDAYVSAAQVIASHSTWHSVFEALIKKVLMPLFFHYESAFSVTIAGDCELKRKIFEAFTMMADVASDKHSSQIAWADVFRLYDYMCKISAQQINLFEENKLNGIVHFTLAAFGNYNEIKFADPGASEKTKFEQLTFPRETIQTVLMTAARLFVQTELDLSSKIESFELAPKQGGSTKASEIEVADFENSFSCYSFQKQPITSNAAMMLLLAGSQLLNASDFKEWADSKYQSSLSGAAKDASGQDSALTVYNTFFDKIDVSFCRGEFSESQLEMTHAGQYWSFLVQAVVPVLFLHFLTDDWEAKIDAMSKTLCDDCHQEMEEYRFEHTKILERITNGQNTRSNKKASLCASAPLFAIYNLSMIYCKSAWTLPFRSCHLLCEASFAGAQTYWSFVEILIAERGKQNALINGAKCVDEVLDGQLDSDADPDDSSEKSATKTRGNSTGKQAADDSDIQTAETSKNSEGKQAVVAEKQRKVAAKASFLAHDEHGGSSSRGESSGSVKKTDQKRPQNYQKQRIALLSQIITLGSQSNIQFAVLDSYKNFRNEWHNAWQKLDEAAQNSAPRESKIPVSLTSPENLNYHLPHHQEIWKEFSKHNGSCASAPFFVDPAKQSNQQARGAEKSLLSALVSTAAKVIFLLNTMASIGKSVGGNEPYPPEFACLQTSTIFYCCQRIPCAGSILHLKAVVCEKLLLHVFTVVQKEIGTKTCWTSDLNLKENKNIWTKLLEEKLPKHVCGACIPCRTNYNRVGYVVEWQTTGNAGDPKKIMSEKDLKEAQQMQQMSNDFHSDTKTICPMCHNPVTIPLIPAVWFEKPQPDKLTDHEWRFPCKETDLCSKVDIVQLSNYEREMDITTLGLRLQKAESEYDQAMTQKTKKMAFKKQLIAQKQYDDYCNLLMSSCGDVRSRMMKDAWISTNESIQEEWETKDAIIKKIHASFFKDSTNLTLDHLKSIVETARQTAGKTQRVLLNYTDVLLEKIDLSDSFKDGEFIELCGNKDLMHGKMYELAGISFGSIALQETMSMINKVLDKFWEILPPNVQDQDSDFLRQVFQENKTALEMAVQDELECTQLLIQKLAAKDKFSSDEWSCLCQNPFQMLLKFYELADMPKSCPSTNHTLFIQNLTTALQEMLDEERKAAAPQESGAASTRGGGNVAPPPPTN